MIYRYKENKLSASPRCEGFSLAEVMAALIILALVTSSVLVVINRCMSSAADSALRMQAFEVARENMEGLLASDSVSEVSEYGNSDKYPEIQWQTIVEPFYEPITNRMWVQAVCSAEYTDTAGEVQTIELTHWLTNLTKEQLLEIIEERKKEKELLAEAEQLIETIEEAAEYAGVDEETIEEWVRNGMPRTEDGDYIELYLDLYEAYDGDPPIEAKMEVAKTYAELTGGLAPKGPEEALPEELEGVLPEVPKEDEGPVEPKSPTEPKPELPCDPPGPDASLPEIIDFIKRCM